MTTLTIRLPEELKTEIDAISRDENRGVSEIVRESLLIAAGICIYTNEQITVEVL